MRIRPFFRILSNISASLAIVFVLAYMIGLRPVVVITGSMEPTIPTGSCVIVNQMDKAVFPGDVIAYELPGVTYPIIHRFVEADESGALLTKGDGNDAADPWRVTSSALKGKVVYILPWLRINNESRLRLLLAALFTLPHIPELLLNLIKRTGDKTTNAA